MTTISLVDKKKPFKTRQEIFSTLPVVISYILHRAAKRR